MTKIVETEVAALLRDYWPVIDKNRWRTLCALYVVLFGAIAALSGGIGTSYLQCTRGQDCDAREIVAYILFGSAAWWGTVTLVMFGVWWACREYRVVFVYERDRHPPTETE